MFVVLGHVAGTAKIARFAADKGLGFRVVMGGLRAGGGDPWNDQFRSFLRNEWQHIAQVTRQPFSFKLLDRPFFNYDTERACRAVAVVRALSNDEALTLDFVSRVQRKFYVDGDNSKLVEFYRPICTEVGLSFDDFAKAFGSAEAIQEVGSHFKLARELGARGFPSVIAQVDGKVRQLSVGYRNFAALEPVLNQLMTEAVAS